MQRGHLYHDACLGNWARNTGKHYLEMKCYCGLVGRNVREEVDITDDTDGREGGDRDVGNGAAASGLIRDADGTGDDSEEVGDCRRRPG